VTDSVVPLLFVMSMTALASIVMVAQLIFTREPMATVLGRWGSRMADAFWSLA